jgi:hypothetical protein
VKLRRWKASMKPPKPKEQQKLNESIVPSQPAQQPQAIKPKYKI